MGLGLIDQTVLADIANAIREQNGTDATYRPADMAAAVLALDGTKAGAGTTATFPSKVGVVSDNVFSAVAEAIRRQNGTSTKYKPAEMGDAIRALSWDVGLKPRALLLDDGTLELNYLDGRQVRSGTGLVRQAWEVPAAGLSRESDRPWHAVRNEVRRVWVDESFAQLSFPDVSYWFCSMGGLTDVFGFQNIRGYAKATQLFSGCGELQSIWAPGFEAPAVTSCFMAFYSCHRLVGGHLDVAKDPGSSKAGFSTGAGGYLVDPADDARRWASGWLYSDGSLVVTRDGAADGSKALAAGGTLCANARHNALGSMPWHGLRDTIASVTFAPDMAGVEALCMDYWFYNCKAASISFSGWGNLMVASMEFCFNGCLNLRELDLRGLVPSGCGRWTNAFAAMSSLTTIYVSDGWALPATLDSKSQTFYGDRLLVGGNGTAYDDKRAGADMAVIDKPGQVGYLTAG